MALNDCRANDAQRWLTIAGSSWPSHGQRRVSQQWLKMIGATTVEPTIAEDSFANQALLTNG
jgi:hypothetical protein